MSCCPHCLRPATGKYCRKCGGKIEYEAKQGQLPFGTLLNGTQGRVYQLGAVRGQGGFGITYVAKELNSDQRVAVKEYFPTYCAGRTSTSTVAPMMGKEQAYQEGKEAFMREAQMLSTVGALDAVVTILDYFEANGTMYLVMDYIEGKSLRELVEESGRISPHRLLPLLEGLFHDLRILHQAGMIHRDISPDNLIMMVDGKIKLLDFGSARRLDVNKDMTMLLKAGFSPFEQYQSRGQGTWTDVYAFAATIYYCLTGCVPPISVDRRSEDTLLRPTALGVQLTDVQEAALLRAMAVSVSERTPDIPTFHEELYHTTPVVQAVPEKTQKNTFNWKIPALIGAAALILGASVAVGFLLPGWLEKEPETKEKTKPKEPVKVCEHEKTSKVYEQQIFGEHIVKTICENEDCGKEIGEAVTEACVDEDADHTCDLCGVTEYSEILEEDDYRYGISMDRSSCAIVEYTGEEEHIEIPSKLGGVAVTTVAPYAFSEADFLLDVDISEEITVQSNAFSECKNLSDIILRSGCVVEENAFADCKKLTGVNVYQSVLLDPLSFSGCTGLRCGTYHEETVFDEVELPSDFKEYDRAMDIGLPGEELWVSFFENGTVYGITDSKKYVVLDLPEDKATIHIDDDTIWICEDALDGVKKETQIVLGDNTEFPYELLDRADWIVDKNTWALAWYASCLYCSYLNEEMGTDTVRPHLGLVSASRSAVEDIHKDQITDDGEEVKVLEKYLAAEEIYSSGQMQVDRFASTDDAATTWLEERAKEMLAVRDDYTIAACVPYIDGDEATILCVALAK